MKIIKYMLILLILGTLIFIYAQSLKSPEESLKDSETVGGIIAEVIPPDTKPGEFIQTNIRKLAHFTEFFVLGLELGAFVMLFYKKLSVFLLSLPMGAILALFDETIQIFTERGPSVTDVWIDVLGYSIAFVSVGLVVVLAGYIMKTCEKRRSENENG
jgi:VanZ family protein